VVAVASSVVGTSLPGFKAFCTASDGHAYRSTVAPGIAAPLGPVTVPPATAAPDDADDPGREPKARSGKQSTAASTI
jgi:hypothetical protein